MPSESRDFTAGQNEPGSHHGEVAEVYEDGERRRARCSCLEYRTNGSCQATWLAALVQAGLSRLNRLGLLDPMPTFRLYFGDRRETTETLLPSVAFSASEERVAS